MSVTPAHQTPQSEYALALRNGGLGNFFKDGERVRWRNEGFAVPAEAAATAALYKPFRPKVLLRTIQTAIGVAA
jgi:hypothetical protein